MSKRTVFETPDRVCAAYANQNVKLTIKDLGEDGDMVLIEGEPQALEFLGKLLLAQVASEDCGFQIAPHRAGQALFSEESTKGLYIHRLPRADQPDQS